jgi:hypothetical protein
MIHAKHYDGTKHLEVKYFFLREKYEDGTFARPQYIPSEENAADLYTKAVTAQTFAGLVTKVVIPKKI